ncbi:hypothetical protein M3G18_02385 [Corynebacterium sp. p3-SID1145]|uniref:hypothetical protein n=1 Tax=unclassified Corynebacterium TaxID=2624378 RepID=UPI0021A9924F|nr:MULTISPECIES: hypothetical protein [unclassified Corynebacterium]MCT1451762.1 hypothetical protein [Corynebacterium sp. p3-SID1145]MCT1460859.1 hypothetical protein [Corynebacterium sp. p3-SID1140]
MKKFTNAAAASVLAGALVLAAAPANAATTATTATTATAAPKAEKVEEAAKAEKAQKENLTWEEKQKRDRAQIEITDARLDNAKKGLDVTNGIIKSAGDIKDLFTPSFLKGDGASSLIKGIAKIVGKIIF